MLSVRLTVGLLRLSCLPACGVCSVGDRVDCGFGVCVCVVSDVRQREPDSRAGVRDAESHGLHKTGL